MNKKLTEVNDLLKKDGVKPEDIYTFNLAIANAVDLKVNAELISNLTDEDMKELDKCETQEEADSLIRITFTNRSNQSIDQIGDHIITTIATNFLEAYQKDHQTALDSFLNPPVESAPTTPPTL